MAHQLDLTELEEWKARARAHPGMDWTEQPAILWKALERPVLRFRVTGKTRAEAVNAAMELRPVDAVSYARGDLEPLSPSGPWRCSAVAVLRNGESAPEWPPRRHASAPPLHASEPSTEASVGQSPPLHAHGEGVGG